MPDAHDTLSNVASRELIPEYDLYQTNSFQALDQTYPVSILKSNKQNDGRGQRSVEDMTMRTTGNVKISKESISHERHKSITARGNGYSTPQRLFETQTNSLKVSALHKKELNNTGRSKKKAGLGLTKLPRHNLLDLTQLNPDSARDTTHALTTNACSDYGYAA